MSRLQKSERLFYIVKYLDNYDTATAEELAKRCKTSVRSIYRDIKTLESLGYYIITEGKKGYKLISHPIQLPKNLTADERKALILFPLLFHTLMHNDLPYIQEYIAGMEKISNRLRAFSSNISEHIFIQENDNNASQALILSRIMEALIERLSLEITYYSIYRDGTSKRTIDPYYLVPREGNLYIIAKCHMRNDIRIFRINRIKSIALTNRNFILPDNFEIEKYLENRWSILGDDDKPTTFVVEFNKSVARYVLEYNFYAETKLKELKNGNLILRTTVKSKAEFLRWIRSFGLDAEVLEPQAVRQQLRSEYAQMYKIYK